MDWVWEYLLRGPFTPAGRAKVAFTQPENVKMCLGYFLERIARWACERCVDGNRTLARLAVANIASPSAVREVANRVGVGDLYLQIAHVSSSLFSAVM